MARTAREATCSGEEERILNNIASSRTASFSEVLRANYPLLVFRECRCPILQKNLYVEPNNGNSLEEPFYRVRQ